MVNPRVRRAPEPFPPTTFHGPSPTPMLPPGAVPAPGSGPNGGVAGDFRGQGSGQPPPPAAAGPMRPPTPQQTPMAMTPQPRLVSGGAQAAPQAPPPNVIAPQGPPPNVAMGYAGMYPGQYGQPPSTAQGWRDMQMGLGQYAYNTLGAGVAGGYGMAVPQNAQLNPFAPTMAIGGPSTAESEDVARRRQRLASEAKLRGAEYQPPAATPQTPVYGQQTFAGPGQPPPAPAGVAPVQQQQSWSSAVREAGAGAPLPQGGGSTPEPVDHVFKQTAAASGEDGPGGAFGSTLTQEQIDQMYPDIRGGRVFGREDIYYNEATHETFRKNRDGTFTKILDKKGYAESGSPYVAYDGSKGEPSEGMTWQNPENQVNFVYHNGDWVPVDPKGTVGQGRWGGDAASQKLDTEPTSKEKLDDAYARQAALEEQRRKWIEDNYKPEQLNQGAVDNVIRTQRTQNAMATSRAARGAMALTQRTGVDPSVGAIALMEAFQNNEAQSNAQGAQTQLQAEMTNLQQRSAMTQQKLAELNDLAKNAANREVQQWAAQEALKTQDWSKWYQVQQDQLQMQLAQANASRQQWGGIAAGIGGAIGSLFGPIGSIVGGALGGVGGTAASAMQAPAGYHQAYPGTYYSNW